MTTRTKSRSVDTHLERSREKSPCLYLVLEALRPTAPPVRFPLAATTEVAIGRDDDGRHFERESERLLIGLADPWLSTQHALLCRDRGRWLLKDTSKNGTLVNGKAVLSPMTLSDGDVVEAQHGFFVFREGVETGRGDVVGDGSRSAASTLTTIIPSLGRAFDELAVISQSPLSILLRGETGTGKEVIARTIHELSRRTGAFVAVNCGAIPSNLVESELFGSKRGAFSGATDRPGLIRAADGGTLFLDEIGDLPLPAQAAFLRVLQEREVVPVGGTAAVPVDIRVVCASHRDVGRMVEERIFRADLFQRLVGRSVDLPPLRERREDLGLLIAAILRKVLANASEAEIPPIRGSAARGLVMYDWPGNIRELEQALAGAVVLAGRSRIELKHLPPRLTEYLQRMATASQAVSKESEDDRALREELERLLAEHEGNVTAVARAKGKRRQQVQRWMKRLRVTSPRTRRDEVE